MQGVRLRCLPRREQLHSTGDADSALAHPPQPAQVLLLLLPECFCVAEGWPKQQGKVACV